MFSRQMTNMSNECSIKFNGIRVSFDVLELRSYGNMNSS